MITQTLTHRRLWRWRRSLKERHCEGWHCENIIAVGQYYLSFFSRPLIPTGWPPVCVALCFECGGKAQNKMQPDETPIMERSET